MSLIKNRNLRKILGSIFAVLLAGFFAVLGLILLVYFDVFGPLPESDVLKGINNEEASLVYASEGELIGKYFARNRTNIKWDDVPEHLKQALIATEDKRFFSHLGYDTRSYLRVFLRSILLRDKSGGGGSTLTQQLIKNLYGRGDFGFLSMPVNKIKEAIIAARIEKIYSKEELLLLYLNSVPFGEDVYGIETAARRYFDKSTNDLKIEESAVLIGLLKANTYFNPRLHPENSMTRRNVVLSLMANENYINVAEADSLKRLPLVLNYENFNLQAPAGYFVYQVKKRVIEILENYRDTNGKPFDLEKDGLRIHSTLNLTIQKMADEAVKSHLSGMQKLLDAELKRTNLKTQWLEKLKSDSSLKEEDFEKHEVELVTWDGFEKSSMTKADSLWYYHKMLHAAVLITQPKTGAVRCWVGGNHFRYLPFDQVLSHRQIASAFKPVLYATAIQEGYKACSYLTNEEREYEAYNNWHPRNFDHSSTPDSLVALWYALAHSMNLPSVDLYFKLGPEKLIAMCNKLGLPPVIDDAPSIALGALDVSLYEIVRTYGVFANQGQFSELVMIDEITEADGNLIYKRPVQETRQAIDSSSCKQITDILQKAINEGTGTKIRTRYGIASDLAGKTGTAQNYSNAWFLAYTPDLVVGTWVGARTPEVHFNSAMGTGGTLALPIVGAILQEIEKDGDLKSSYLSPFESLDSLNQSLTCEPYQKIAKKGLLERIFNTEKKEKRERPQKEKDRRNIFKRWFKKKQ